MDNVNNLIKIADDPSGKKLNLKDSDVVQIWDEVSSFIEKFMIQSKGVTIPSFGTFSFSQKRLDIGNNKFILVHRPVFSMAEKFIQTHSLKQTKYPIAGNIPVHPLNYVAISHETAFSRDDIESCVRHVLQVLNRSVASKKNVEFTFTGIGRLQIRNFKVKMKFFKTFVNACDPNGKVISSMQNRPHTADSVISRNDLHSRSQTRNTCILPRINSRTGAFSSLDNLNSANLNASMDTIKEEGNEAELKQEKNGELETQQVQSQNNDQKSAHIVAIYSSEDVINSSNNNQKNESTIKTIATAKYHIPNVYEALDVSSSSLKSFNNEPNGSINNELNQNETKSINNFELSFTNNQPGNNVARITSGNRKKIELTRPSSRSLVNGLIPAGPRSLSASVHNIGSASSMSNCGHINAGQELCYLCHQRQRRNIPVYLHEEMRIKEKEENQLLSQYQHLKDMEQQLKDEEKRNNLRMDRVKIDAYNMGITEALKAKKLERPKTSDISRSYVFRKRCKTPPKFVKQQEMSDALRKQVEAKQKEFIQMKQENDYLEKMEQVKLAEDLAARREAYLKQKNQRQVELKHTLDMQVKNKPPELPRVLPDGEVFGEYDAKNERLSLMKQREIETFKFHKELVENKKREKLLQHVKDQEEEAENLDRVREEYKCDRANRFKRMYEMRKDLEQDWMRAFEEKKFRDIDEIQHRLAHDGLIVHEQCDKYNRCSQCQRDVKNCGESNIWKETRNTAGNRLMV